MSKLLIIIVAAISVATSVSVDAETPKCPSRSAERAKPLVATPETAKAIFLAVEEGFFPKADKIQFPDIEAVDDGEFWSIFRWKEPKPERNGDIVISGGGGQLSMRIEKCDGRIWHVYFTR